MADREFVDLFVRLKGDIKQLDKLNNSGLNVKVNLNLSKARNGGFAKIQKLKQGLNINVKFNLTGRGYQKILNLQKGITIPVKFNPTGSLQGTTARVARRQQQQSNRDLNLTDIRAFSKSGVAIGRPSSISRVTARRSSGSFDDFIDQILPQRVGPRTVNSFRRGTVNTVTGNPRAFSSGSQSGTLDKFFSAKDLREIKGQVVSKLTGGSTTRSFTANDPASRRNQLSDFRRRETLRRAQEEFDLSSPLFGSISGQRRRIALQNNILPGDLSNPRRRGLAGLTRGVVNPRRLFNREAAREIGFAALFGGDGGREFGLLGEALSTVGAVSGAAIGGSLAPGGGLIGTVVAEKGIEALFRTVASLGEKFREAAELGLQFEESIVGISSVLQATTIASSPSGGALSVRDQLGVQTQRARDIQQLARQRLLPLGIGGQTEGALVSGIITGFAQQGVSLTPEQASQLAERFGGAIQAQRPDLLRNTNRLRLEIEDAISNPGRITALTPVLRAFAPNVGRATSGEEALRLTQGLEAFPQALTQNTESAVIALRQFNAEIENFKVVFGSEFLQALTPGLKALGDVLKDKTIQQNLTKLARELGTILSIIATGFSRILELGKGFASIFGGGTAVGAAAGGVSGTIGGGLFGTAAGGAIGSAFGPAGTIIGAGIGNIAGSLLNGGIGAISGGIIGSSANPIISNLAGTAGSSRQAAAQRRRRARITPTAESSIELFNRIGSLDALTVAESFIPNLNSGQQLAARIDAANRRVGAIGEERSRAGSGFDTFLASGAFGRAQSNLGFDNQLIGTQRELVRLREQELNIAKRQVAASPGNQAAVKKQLDAEFNLQQARQSLSAATVQAAQSSRALFAAITQRSNERLSGVNTGTFSGQRAALNIRGQTLQRQLGALDSAAISPEERALRRAQLAVTGQNLANQRELQPFNEGIAQTNLLKVAQEYQFNQQNVNAELQGYQDALSRATLALDDFNASGDLRDALDSQKRVEAAKGVIASGGIATGLQSIDEIAAARGDKDAQARISKRISDARFAQTLRQTDPERRAFEDGITRRGLQRRVDRAGFNLSQFPLNFLNRQLGLGKQITSLGQQFQGGVFSDTDNIFSDFVAPGGSDSSGLNKLIGSIGGANLTGKVSDQVKRRVGVELLQAASGASSLFANTEGDRNFLDREDVFGFRTNSTDVFGGDLNIRTSSSARENFKKVIKQQAALPKANPVQQAANENLGVNIIAAINGLKQSIDNPTGFGTQMNNSLNRQFSGGHR